MNRIMKHLERLLVASLFITLGAANFAQSKTSAAPNTTISGIQNVEGDVVVAVFDEPDTFENMDVQDAVALTYHQASSRSGSMTLHDLPATEAQSVLLMKYW